MDSKKLSFPKRICVGVYKGLSYIASPFVNLWNKSSDKLYKTVNNTPTQELKGADMSVVNNASLNTDEKVNEERIINYSQMPSTLATQGKTQTEIIPVNAREAVEKIQNIESKVNMSVFDNPNGDKKSDSDDKNKSNLDFSKKSTKKVFVPKRLQQSREELLALVNSQNDTRCDHQIIYRYRAISPDGKWVSNTFLSYSRSEAFMFLENEGNTVYSIVTSPTIEKLYGPKSMASQKMSKKDIVFWLQQLSTYLKSGIPLTDSMRILGKQMGKNINTRRIFDGIIYNLTLGESFSSCLEKQGDAFPSILINIVKSAEATGDLEGALDDMADYFGETEKTRKAMISALTYPAMVFVFSIAVVIFLLVYLIPQFESIYQQAGAELNPLTKFLLNLSKFMKSNWSLILLVLLIIAVVIFFLYKKVKAARYAMQTFAMKLPIIGKIIIYKEMMIFTKTFANLLNNNVFITESMEILQKTTNNEIYRDIMLSTIDYIGRGEKISSAFQNHWAVPDVAYYMMVTGESTGELAGMMQNVANYYSIQHKSIIDSMKSLIEPIMIIFLAVTVGGILIAVIVPLFGLYSKIQ